MSEWTDEEIERALGQYMDNRFRGWTKAERLRAALDAVPAVPLRKYEAVREVLAQLVALKDGPRDEFYRVF